MEESPVSSKVRHPSSCLPDPTEVSLCILLIIPPLFPQTSPGVRPCQGFCGRVEGGTGETGDCWSVLLFKPSRPLCPSCACLASHSCHTLPSCQVLRYGCGGGAVLLGRFGPGGPPSHSPIPSFFMSPSPLLVLLLLLLLLLLLEVTFSSSSSPLPQDQGMSSKTVYDDDQAFNEDDEVRLLSNSPVFLFSSLCPARAESCYQCVCQSV